LSNQQSTSEVLPSSIPIKMQTVAIALLVACVVGSSLAQDCSTKIKDFHKCVEDSHKTGEADRKAKFEALKPKLDACYTTNGCTPPVKGQKGKVDASGASGEQKGNNTAGRECRKALQTALKGKFEDCVKQAIPDFTFPPKDAQHDKGHGGEHRGFDHKEDNKALEGCTNKQAVRDCKRALFNGSQPTDAEKRAHFKTNCDAKQVCLTALGADCQAQVDKFKQAACQCRQQQRQQAEQLRASTPACTGVPEKKDNRANQKQQTCDNKDYCKLGYDAFVADHPKGKGH